MQQVVPQIPEHPPITNRKKIRKIVLLLALLIGLNVIVFGGLYLLLSKSSEENSTNPISTFISPTPFAFQEVTIPYLRSREYSSSISELNKVTENSLYDGYLTSYDSDGLSINGYLTIPKGDEPDGGWPAVVFVHGYIPPGNYQTLGSYSSYVDYLSRNGFVVFKIDLRGHGESDGEAGGSYYSSDYIIDTLNARAALQSLDYVDPMAVGLFGHSMAGNVVARALAAAPDIPAIAIWAGAVYTYEDFSEFGIDDNSYQPPSTDSPSRRKRAEMFEKYGQFSPDSAFWKQVPMTNYLSDVKGAISLNHAIDDSVVSISYSRNLDRILDGTTIQHELNEYQSGGHNFTGSTFTQAMQKTVDFFHKFLK